MKKAYQIEERSAIGKSLYACGTSFLRAVSLRRNFWRAGVAGFLRAVFAQAVGYSSFSFFKRSPAAWIRTPQKFFTRRFDRFRPTRGTFLAQYLSASGASDGHRLVHADLASRRARARYLGFGLAVVGSVLTRGLLI